MHGNIRETKWAVLVFIKGTATPCEETEGPDSSERGSV